MLQKNEPITAVPETDVTAACGRTICWPCKQVCGRDWLALMRLSLDPEYGGRHPEHLKNAAAQVIAFDPVGRAPRERTSVQASRQRP
jgi:hypothetical protein